MEILVTNTELKVNNYTSKLQFEDSWVSVKCIYFGVLKWRIEIYLCCVRGDGAPQLFVSDNSI